MLSFKEILLIEKQVFFNSNAKSGQVVFLAGGAGSGKGFAFQHFLSFADFRVFDVDEVKKLLLKLRDTQNKYPELKGLNLKNPEDVSKLHMFVKEKGLFDRKLETFFSNIDRSGQLPNLAFDKTFKNFDDIEEVIPRLLDIGYNPKDIHIVWVLSNFYIAQKQNAARDRTVSPEIMLKTHSGAAMSMYKVLKGSLPKGIDGSIVVILGGENNSIPYEHPVTGELMDGKKREDGSRRPLLIKDFKYLRIKESGRPVRTEADIQKEVEKWMMDNIPTDVKQQIFQYGK